MGPDWRVIRRWAGSRDGEPDPVHLDCGSPGAPLVGPGAAGARVRLASVLGYRGLGGGAVLHDGALADSQQGRLEARPADGGSSMRPAVMEFGTPRNRTRSAEGAAL